jgi:predicted phosphatase
MDLRTNIKRILREETNKDLTPVIEMLLEGFVNDHKNEICKVEVKHPDKRTKLPYQEYPYKNYRVTFYIIKGDGRLNSRTGLLSLHKFDDLMNEAFDLIYSYTGERLEMFIKHVKSCGDIIQENKENSIPKMIKILGLYDAIRYFGDYYKIEPYLKVIDKVNFIKEKVYELNNGRSINLIVINGETIHYSEKDGKLHMMEWLGKDSVTVKTYGDNGNYIGTFYVNYESLPVEIIEQLVEILLNN